MCRKFIVKIKKNNNNNKQICKAPLGRNFRGDGRSRLCVLVIGLMK